jgi:hypothetical protein
MISKCRIVGSDKIFETTQELAKHLGVRTSYVLRPLYNPESTIKGLRLEFVDLKNQTEEFKSFVEYKRKILKERETRNRD